MITSIPVHPMTFRILVKENEILDVDNERGVLIKGVSNSMVNDLLNFGNIDKEDATKSVKTKLTAIINVEHSNKINKPHNLGFYLHKMYMRKVLQFIHAQVLAGISATQSIRNFCKLYQIEEDDIPQETLGRLWRRYYFSINHGKKSNKSLIKIRNIVLKNSDLSLISDIEKFDLSERISNMFIRHNLDHYFNCRKHFNRSLMNQTIAFTLYSVFSMKQKKIAQSFEITTQSANRRITTFKYFLLSDDMLAESYENMIKVIL